MAQAFIVVRSGGSEPIDSNGDERYIIVDDDITAGTFLQKSKKLTMRQNDFTYPIFNILYNVTPVIIAPNKVLCIEETTAKDGTTLYYRVMTNYQFSDQVYFGPRTAFEFPSELINPGNVAYSVGGIQLHNDDSEFMLFGEFSTERTVVALKCNLVDDVIEIVSYETIQNLKGETNHQHSYKAVSTIWNDEQIIVITYATSAFSPAYVQVGNSYYTKKDGWKSSDQSNAAYDGYFTHPFIAEYDYLGSSSSGILGTTPTVQSGLNLVEFQRNYPGSPEYNSEYIVTSPPYILYQHILAAAQRIGIYNERGITKLHRSFWDEINYQTSDYEILSEIESNLFVNRIDNTKYLICGYSSTGFVSFLVSFYIPRERYEEEFQFMYASEVFQSEIPSLNADVECLHGIDIYNNSVIHAVKETNGYRLVYDSIDNLYHKAEYQPIDGVALAGASAGDPVLIRRPRNG